MTEPPAVYTACPAQSDLMNQLTRAGMDNERIGEMAEGLEEIIDHGHGELTLKIHDGRIVRLFVTRSI